jgi:hypothetical protein
VDVGAEQQAVVHVVGAALADYLMEADLTAARRAVENLAGAVGGRVGRGSLRSTGLLNWPGRSIRAE